SGPRPRSVRLDTRCAPGAPGAQRVSRRTRGSGARLPGGLRAELAAHEPAGAVAAVPGGRGGAVESRALERLDRPDVAGDDVDLLLALLDGIALDHLGPVRGRVLDGAGEQVVHEPLAAEPRPHDEAHDAP